MKTLFSRIISRIEATWGIEKEFRLKVLFLTLSFFMLTACQALWRPIKSAVFITMVGVKHIPDAKFFLIFPMIILIFIYSKLVDWLRRHHLFYWFAISHALIGILMYFVLSHPVYGIANTTQSPNRIFGWVFYFFIESFGAFMSAVFWSFANSINKPKDARKYYSILVVGSKVGGILGAGTALLVASQIDTSITLIPNMVLVGSVLLLLSAIFINLLMKHVPGYLMHGYEAAYQYEKKKVTEKRTLLQSIKHGAEGLVLLIKNPYVFGIFSIILSYEVIIVIVDFLVQLAAAETHSTAGGLLGFFTLYQLIMHSVGLLIALFGTAPVQRFLGIRLSLFVAPGLTILILPIIFFYPTMPVLFCAYVFFRALSYGFQHPTREALFIPTTKDIKFKAKAWTDAFGSRISKAGGSILNKHVLFGFARQSSVLCMLVAGGWLVASYFLGRTYQETINQNKVIGAKEPTE